MEKNSGNKYKIAIVGPESTGKSTLTEALALHFNEPWVKEVAREYVSNVKRPYVLKDVEIMAQLQLESEAMGIKNAQKFLFCDTTLLVHKIWADFVFNEIPPEIVNNYHPQNYHLHLLCNIDLPWTPDPLREHPNHREELFFRYENELKLSGANYYVVNGRENQRVKNAINFIKRSLPDHKF